MVAGKVGENLGALGIQGKVNAGLAHLVAANVGALYVAAVKRDFLFYGHVLNELVQAVRVFCVVAQNLNVFGNDRRVKKLSVFVKSRLRI